MTQEKIIDYIRLAKSQKIPKKQIIANLLKVGWKEEEIKKGIADESQLAIPLPPNFQTNTPENFHDSMKDAFEHILMFISLYVLAISLGLMLHSFIDKWFPIVSSDISKSYFLSFQSTLIRVYIAALIVSYPFFAFFFLNLTKKTMDHPTLIELKSRKTLIYFTLVITFLLFIYKFISIVYTMINGNITFNFILHLIVTLLISGVIFGYYLNQIKIDSRTNA